MNKNQFNKTIWDKKYESDVYIYGKDANNFLKTHMSDLPKNGHILCLADGEGRNSVYLAKLGFKVTAIDISINAIRKAQKLAKENEMRIN